MPIKWEPAIYDAPEFKSALGDDSNLKIRRNINPALLRLSDMEALAEKFNSELSMFANPIAGTGILPFDFNPNNFLNFKRSVLRCREQAYGLTR